MSEEMTDALETIGEDLELDEESADQVKGGFRFFSKKDIDHKVTSNFCR